jgi:hypothetical protein
MNSLGSGVVPSGRIAGGAGRPASLDSRHAGSQPTDEQHLLLRAALLHGSDAIEAWRTWRSRVDFEQIDHASARLLPLVYRNLESCGITDTLMDKLKGTYRLTWTKNLLLFHRMVAVLQSLRDEGLETLILKGAALIVQYYHEYGLRPMSDFDVLVHPEHAEAAVRLLAKLGLMPSPSPFKSFGGPTLYVTHAHSFVDSEGHHLDLHWHLIPDCTYNGADDAFWEKALPLEVYQVPTLALNPTDQLFHLCAHGMLWSQVSPIRWAADAATVLECAQSHIDWERLVWLARSRLLVLPLREALSYLRHGLNAPIPDEALRELDAVRTPVMERLEHRFRRGSKRAIGWLPWHLFQYRRYRQMTAAQPGSEPPLGLMEYLQHLWGLDRRQDVPSYVIAYIGKRLRIMRGICRKALKSRLRPSR